MQTRALRLFLMGMVGAAGCDRQIDVVVSDADEATTSAPQAEAWDVRLDTAALEDLPAACFHTDALVVESPAPAAAHVRWARVTGSPADLYVGRLRFRLADAGDVELPPVLHGSQGIFRATRIRSSLRADGADALSDRSDSTLVLRTEGDRLSGTLHLESARGCREADCAQAQLRCDVSVAVSGRRLGSDWVAAAY